MPTVSERVKTVTAKILKLDPKDISDTADFVRDLGAESLQSIELVAAFEEEFGIEMNEDEALQVKTIDKAVSFISKVMAAQGKA
ncbi:MAG: acyl carrier protein [Planctomycetes bacterium]|nr:acyl carrier protein [Planctomycetota bacterium]MBM4082224.1 acyl carrier protein [Planctomycetota bacterium]